MPEARAGSGAELEGYRRRAETALAALFDGEAVGRADPRLREAMRYSLLAGGKRLRPALLYAAAAAVGGSRASAADTDRAACAIECIHTYSLIHDDLPAMDDDDLRRGKPTCHRAFDEATAILAGDALQTLGFELLCAAGSVDPATRLALVAELAAASGSHGMVGGQAVDVAHVGRPITEAVLETMHALKTGALIRAALRMGALLGAAGAGARASLDEYARCIGLAFQVQDDILDITGDTATLGKPQGSDLALEKSTYPALLGLDNARELARELHDKALTALQALPYNTDILEAFADYIIERTH